MSAGGAADLPGPPVAVYVAAGSNVVPLDSLAIALGALKDRFADLFVSPA